MKLSTFALKMCLIFFSFFYLKLFANDNGFVMEIPCEMTLREIKEAYSELYSDAHISNKLLIEVELDEDKENSRAHFVWDKSMRKHGQYLGFPRDYLQPLSDSDKKDIRYIVTFLANNSLIKIAANRGSLEAAGDRIDHIHPLNFLAYVFSDEELKVGFKNVRGKGWVWGDFCGGLKTTLSTEASIDNMKDEYIKDFSKRVKLDYKHFIVAIQKKNWDGFIETLITKIPRSGDHDRYDE